MAFGQARPPPTPHRGDGPAAKESLMGPVGQAQPSGTDQSRSGRDGEEPTKVAGEMSMGMEDLPLPVAAAGRLGMASRSMSWSRSLQAAPTRQARSDGLRPGALASAWTDSNSRRALSTIRPGKVNLATDNTASFRFILLARLCGLALGATDSSSGMATQCDFQTRFQP